MQRSRHGRKFRPLAKSTKYLTMIIGLICGVELVVAIVLGGAAVSTIFGLEGAMVASLLTIGALLTLGGWAYRRRRVIRG